MLLSSRIRKYLIFYIDIEPVYCDEYIVSLPNDIYDASRYTYRYSAKILNLYCPFVIFSLYYSWTGTFCLSSCSKIELVSLPAISCCSVCSCLLLCCERVLSGSSRNSEHASKQASTKKEVRTYARTYDIVGLPCHIADWLLSMQLWWDWLYNSHRNWVLTKI